MIEPLPYLTFWQVADRWAKELQQPVMEVIQAMRADSTYLYPHPYECQTPPLIVYPAAFLHAQGVMTDMTVLNACRMVEKDHCEGTAMHQKFRSQYITKEYVDAVSFLNSFESPPEPTEEVKNNLACFVIKKDDFKAYCDEKGYPLPKFWFPALTASDDIGTTTEKFGPEAFVRQQREAGVDDRDIAFLLRKNGLQLGEIANVLCPGVYDKDFSDDPRLKKAQDDRRRQQGYKLVQAGKKRFTEEK